MKTNTKKSIIDKCKYILNKTDINGSVTDEEYEYLLDILPNHPDWDIKKGNGIKDIVVNKTNYSNKYCENRCFYIIRNDDTKIDISYLKAINNPSNKSIIKKACRDAIRQEIVNVKSKINWGFDKCVISGEILYPHNTEIDHYDYPFNIVVENWINSKNEKMLLDNIVFGVFIDNEIIADFVTYHNANTHLRAIIKQENRKRR